MARIIPFLANPVALSSTVAQFGLTGLLAAGAGLLWSWALGSTAAAGSVGADPRRRSSFSG